MTGAATDRYVLLADVPPGTGDGGRGPDGRGEVGRRAAARDADVLGFADVAGRLADLVLESRLSTPMAVGVLGGWGSGKSTLMRFVESELGVRRTAGGAKVETVWFDAWVTEGAEVLESMIKLVLAAIGPDVVRKAVRNKRLVLGARLAVTLALAWLPWGSNWIDRFWDRVSVDGKARNDLRELLGSAMAGWRRKQAARGERVLVVFVDNLDRCSEDKVVDVFEAIKIYLDEPGFVFVIGYDQQMVGGAVMRDRHLDPSRAAQYLEKVVQIEYRVPRPDDAQAGALVDALVERSGTGGLLGAAERALITERTDRNPRRVKRFLNNFVLSQRLDATAGLFSPQEYIKVLLLRMYFPRFYDLLTAPGDRDPITEFLEYAAYEQSVQSGARLPEPEVTALFGSFGRAAPTAAETPRDSLDRLRPGVPEEIVALSTDDDFRSLLESLGDGPARLDLVRRVRGGRAAFEAVPTGGATIDPEDYVGSGWSGTPDLIGRVVLWLDDEPENNRSAVAHLRGRGAEVIEVRTRGDAERVLAARGPGAVDLLISDLTRYGDPDAGFTDYQALRDSGAYVGPVAYQASRITAERRARATALGAVGIGSTLEPALRYLEQRPPRREPAEPSSAAS